MQAIEEINDDLSPELEKLVQQGIDILKAGGFKITQKRRELLIIFAQNQRYLTAQNIHQALVKKYPTMSYNTTYRNLYDFVELDILETTEYQQEQLFRYNCFNTGHADHHHHHFICTNCGRTLQLDVCPMDQAVAKLKNVTIESHRFEVFGLCQNCRTRNSGTLIRTV